MILYLKRRAHVLMLIAAGLLTACSADVTTAPPTTGSLAIEVGSLPRGVAAAITVSGSQGFTVFLAGPQVLDRLPPGSYAVAAASVANGDSTYAPAPAIQTALVTAGASVTARVAYTGTSIPPTLGALTVVVTGLPPAATGNVTVTGPGIDPRFIAGTQTLVSLAPGSYGVTATAVTVLGVEYVPTPASQVSDVAAGSTATVTVSYAVNLATLSPGFQMRIMVVAGVAHAYQIFVPVGYTPEEKWPVILFLHGSGEGGTDGVKEVTNGLGPYVRAHAGTFPAIVVFPQVPVLTSGGSIIQLADSIDKTALDLTLAEVRADSTRIYLTGLSQGADFSWDLAYQDPARYAAVVPIAGGICGSCIVPGTNANEQDSVVAVVAETLKLQPIWVFHGSADPNAPVVEERKVVAAFQAVGSPIMYTEYAGLGHDVWDITYADPDLWTWLFAQHR